MTPDIQLPWKPLFTVYRSHRPEITLYGIVSVIEGDGNVLCSLGDQNQRIWTRSVLKPWQLLNHFHILKEHYPELREEHYALMMSSHSAENIHEQTLDEIHRIGGIDESYLQNTPLYPVNPKRRIELRTQSLPPRERWSCCSGKHSGFVMALKATGKDYKHYLNKGAEHFVRMKNLLGWLLQEDPGLIPETTDGCRLPNYAFTAPNIAKLYQRLWWSVDELGLPEAPDDIKPMVPYYADMARIMNGYAEYVGGTERIDTELMQGRYTLNDIELIAKEGADGVLAVGMKPNRHYPKGLGIAIKSSSGDDPRYFSVVIFELLNQLGLLRPAWQRQNKLAHINYEFHFNVRKFARS